MGDLYGTITVDDKPAMQALGKVQKGFSQTGDAADKAQAEVDAASRKVEKSLQREADAAGNVRVAQAKLTEALKNGTTDSAKFVAAQERLETANRKLAAAQGDARRSVEELGRAEEEMGKSFDGAESKIEGFGTKGAVLAAAAGAAIGAALAAGVMRTMDIEKANDKLAAQLGLNARESEKAGEIAGSLFAGAYGESIEEVNTAVGGVMSSISGMRDASSADVEATTAKVLDMASAFEIDVTRASQVAGQMISTGLAGDATEALDLLVGSLQRVPAAVREDLLDAVDEYGPFFSQLGIEGTDAMGMLVTAAEDGMYGIDKTGDAVKEFGIRATDMSKLTGDAYETIGLNQEDMTAKLLAGGDEASAAFQDIIKGVQGIEDPVAQSQAALALFGTPLEDLSVTEIPKFLESLTGASGGLGDVAGAAVTMGDTLNENASTRLEAFRRGIETNVTNFIGDSVIPTFEGLVDAVGPAFQWLRDTLPIWGPFAAGIGLVAGAVALWTIATHIQTAALWGQAAAFAAANAPMVAVIAVIGLLVGAVIWAYQNIGWFRDGVDTAFAFIGDVIANVVNWFTGTAVPWFTTALDILGTAFNWLWTYFIKPAFDLISWGVGVLWTVVNGVFQLMIAGLKFALGPAFQWFQDHVQPILDVVGQLIGNLWTKHVEPVFKWMGDGVKAIPTAFGIARDGIARAWNAIKAIARGPVEFVINKVINDGLIGTFNKIPGVNIKPIPLPPGFANEGGAPNAARGGSIRARAKGGYTPPGWTLVGEEGPELVDFTSPGRVYTAKQSAHMLGHAARVDSGASVAGAFMGNRNAIAQHGAYYMNVAPGMGPWNFTGAANMWNGAAGVKVKTGRGHHQGYVSPRERGGGILGYTTGTNIDMSPSWMAQLGAIQRRTVAAHEVGHALGLPHASGHSMMQPNLQNMAAVPTAQDIRNLQALYPGGSGRAGSAKPENPFAGMVGTLVAAIKQAFPGGGMFVDAGVGIAKSGIESVIKFVSDIGNNIGNFVGGIVDGVVGGIRDFFGGGAATVTPTLMDGGGWLRNTDGPTLVDHRRQKPDAFTPFDEWKQVVNHAANSGGGMLEGNLYLDSGEFLGKVRGEVRQEIGSQLQGAMSSRRG